MNLDRHIFLSLAAIFITVAAAGCSDNIEVPDSVSNIPQELEQYYFLLDKPVISRSVSYDSDEHSEFGGGELLGCFALDDSGNAVAGEKANACFAVSVISSSNADIDGHKVLVPDSPSDKLDKGHSAYLFYYPYNPEIKSLAELKRLTHSIKTDQSEAASYEASDLLWDVAKPADRHCLVEMDHVMANIIIVIDGVEYDVEKGAQVIGQPLTAENINLTAPDIESMRNADGSYFYTVDPLQPKADISALYANYSSANDRFRAAVPANRTIKAGTDIIRLWSKKTGLEKIFSLKEDVTLEPGKNYYFTLIRKGITQPEVNDDDSWVLDVLDPETGEPVGLLCREYLRFQRHNDYKIPDEPTVPEDATGQPRLNSQAWVFYNLQSDGKTPELSRGQVLRFIYDVRVNQPEHADDRPDPNNGEKLSGYAWPYPHKKYDYWGGTGFGVFLAKHGYKWTYDESKGYGVPDNPKAFLGDYWMNGGVVIWDGINNRIAEFIMPDQSESATNEDASQYGHIAIPADGSAPYVSYSPFEEGAPDHDGNKIGVVLQHWLIDTRVGLDGQIERRRYPLVKISFNQFWMSKSLRCKTFVDGTPLHCFNTGRMRFDVHEDTPPLAEKGYLYPFLTECNFDPLYDKGEDYTDNVLEMTLLYNYNAYADDRILPVSHESISYYVRPSLDEYKRFAGYLCSASVSKMMYNKSLVVGRGNNWSNEEKIDMFCKGGTLRDLECYVANVSGLNLKAYGCRIQHQSDFKRIGHSASVWIETDDRYKGIVAPAYATYDTWGAHVLNGDVFIENYRDLQPYLYPLNSPEGGYRWEWDATLQKQVWYSKNEGYQCAAFLPARFLLKYKNQKEAVASRAMASPVSVKADNRDVYVAVD